MVETAINVSLFVGHFAEHFVEHSVLSITLSWTIHPIMICFTDTRLFSCIKFSDCFELLFWQGVWAIAKFNRSEKDAIFDTFDRG